MATWTSLQRGSGQHGMLRVLPDSAHEVPVILLVSFQGKTYLVGSIQENLHFPPDVMVRLGSKVSDGHPSSVGFRVFLRSDVPKTSGRQSLEDHYHVVSCKYVPHGNTLSFKATTAQDIHELVAASPFSTTLAKMELPVEQSLWRVDVETSDTNAIIISYHGPHLHTNNDHIKKVAKLLPSVSYAKSVSIFFPAHRILVHHLEEAIKSGWVGMPTPSWKDCLPENALPKWPLNIQTTMVAGSTDLLNVLVTALHEGKVSDGPGTSLHSRPESKKFEDFVQATYPSIKRSPKDKVYPVFLNVADAVCLELPFGASMFNQANTYAAFYAIHELLQVGIPASEIGIITLYPSQAQIYGRMMLECHDYNTERGYNKIKYGLLEEWVGKTIGVAIVDFVRTSNASGNLGLLSQARRLKVVLSLHRDGLIIVGNRGCTMTSDSAASSTKLEKILEFFDNTGRMVPISVTGELMAPTKLPSVEARPTPVRDLELDHKLKERTTSSLSGQNQFKTTKHVRKGSEGATEAFLRFKENFGLQSKASSNAPKTMPEKAVEEPPNLRRQHSRPPHDSIPTAPRAYMDAFARFNARREGKLEIPNPDPNAIFTQNTRQRLSTINDSSMFRNNCHPVSQESSRHNGDTVALQLKPTNPRDESFARMKRNRDAPKNPTAGEKKTPTAESSVVSPALGTDQTNTSISTTALVSNVGDENKKPRNVSNGFSLQAQDSESGIKDGEVLPIVARQGLDTSISSLNAKLEASTLLPTGTQPESPALETHLSPQSPTEQAQTFAPQQEMDFPTRYRQKYQAMKSTFDSFRGGDQSSPNEDQLFRRLGEAFVMEDGKAFEEVYTLLLGELQGCLVGPAAGFQ